MALEMVDDPQDQQDYNENNDGGGGGSSGGGGGGGLLNLSLCCLHFSGVAVKVPYGFYYYWQADIFC